jgi:hypothetical protein
MTVQSMQLSMPDGLKLFNDTFGNPVESSIYSLDCMLNSIGDEISFPIIFKRIALAMGMTVFYTIASLGILLILLRIS